MREMSMEICYRSWRHNTKVIVADLAYIPMVTIAIAHIWYDIVI